MLANFSEAVAGTDPILANALKRIQSGYAANGALERLQIERSAS